MAKGHRLTSRALRNGERESSHRQKRTTTTTVVLQVCAVRGLGTQPVGRMIRIIRGSQSNNSARASALHHGSCLVPLCILGIILNTSPRGTKLEATLKCTPSRASRLPLSTSSSNSNSPKVHFKVRKLENPPAAGRRISSRRFFSSMYLPTYRSIDRLSNGKRGKGHLRERA